MNKCGPYTLARLKDLKSVCPPELLDMGSLRLPWLTDEVSKDVRYIYITLMVICLVLISIFLPSLKAVNFRIAQIAASQDNVST